MDDRKLEQLSFGEDNFIVMGIAASADGKEALKSFLNNIPDKNNHELIIVEPSCTEIKLTPNNSTHTMGVKVTYSDNNKSKKDHNKTELSTENSKNFNIDNNSQLSSLLQSQLYLEAILNTTASFISLKDLKGNYILANSQFLKLLNLSETAVIGKNDFHLFSHDIALNLQKNDRQVLESKKPLQFEEILKFSTGIRSYLAIKTPVYDNENKLYAVCSIYIDITQQKQTEEALKKSVTREHTTLKIVQKISKSLDRQEIFALTTRELRKAIRCDRSVIYQFNKDWSGQFVAESVGNEWSKLVEVNKHKIWFDSYLQETKGGICALEKVFVVNDVYREGLSRCHIDLLEQFQAKACCVVPIFQSDYLWGLLSVYQNSSTRQWQSEEIRLLTHVAIQLGITIKQADLFSQIRHQSARLQQAKETAEAANKAKTAFIAHMNHELRTPLSAILGYAEIIEETTNVRDRKNKINLIHQSGKHLHTLIDDILFLAQLEAGKLELKPKKFDFAYFLDNIIEMIRIRATQKNIELHYQIISSLPSTIFCDETRLRQVLLNLLSNAIKFTQNGRVTFLVGYQEDFQSDRDISNRQSLRFQIEDTGIGIAPSQISDIFLPFQQIKEKDLQTKGTGLGLTISQNIVRLMNSEIKVISTIEKGSTFWFDLNLNWSDLNNQKNINPKTEVITQNKLKNIVIPPLTELYALQELLIVGNIRGLLNKIDILEESNPELKSFTKQIRYLAETCQIDLLENFMQSFN